MKNHGPRPGGYGIARQENEEPFLGNAERKGLSIRRAILWVLLVTSFLFTVAAANGLGMNRTGAFQTAIPKVRPAILLLY